MFYWFFLSKIKKGLGLLDVEFVRETLVFLCVVLCIVVVFFLLACCVFFSKEI